MGAVRQRHCPLVHPDNTIHQGESQSGPWLGAGLAEAGEAPHRLCAEFGEDAGSIIRHFDHDPSFNVSGRDFDEAPLIGIFEGVVDQVADGLLHQISMSEQFECLRAVKAEVDPLLLKGQLVKVGNVFQQLGQIEMGKIAFVDAAFGATNLQGCIKGALEDAGLLLGGGQCRHRLRIFCPR